MLSLSDIETLMVNWHDFSSDFGIELSNTYKMIHQAVQFLAITSKSILPPRYDDSHTSFIWDYQDKCFASEWLNVNHTFRLEIDPVSLSLRLNPYKKQSTDTVQLVGKTKKEVYAQLQKILLKWGITMQHFTNEMHYDLPEHKVNKGGKYQTHSIDLHNEVVKHYSNAYLLLSLLKGKNPLTGDIRCWPHHFDIAADFPLITQIDNLSMKFSLGFSPANPDFPEPHFYFLLRSKEGINLHKKEKLKYGKWYPRDIYGTSLGLGRLTRKMDKDYQVKLIRNYVNESNQVLRDQLFHNKSEKQL